MDPDDYDQRLSADQWEAQVLRLNWRLPSLGVPHERKGVVDLYDVSDDWIPIYDRTDLVGFYVAIGTSGNQFKNAGVAGHCMAELIDAVEAGHDHDARPAGRQRVATPARPSIWPPSAATARSTSTPPCQSTADQAKERRHADSFPDGGQSNYEQRDSETKGNTRRNALLQFASGLGDPS